MISLTGRTFLSYLFLVLALGLAGCSSYKKSLFLKTSKNLPLKGPTADLLVPESEIILPFDILTLEVYAANGEALIDPERALSKATGNVTTVTASPQYTVDHDGAVKLPLIGVQKLGNLNLRTAEQNLQEKYNTFYKDCFVKISVTNKRVTIIANGGKVIPLANEGMTVLEVIGLAGDVTREAKTENIRLLRAGEVILLDLSVVTNYPANNVLVKSGDIIYLEPVRRPFVEGLRDASPLIGLVISLLTLYIFFRSTN
jgi:polysaccharide export outer membrane protein